MPSLRDFDVYDRRLFHFHEYGRRRYGALIILLQLAIAAAATLPSIEYRVVLAQTRAIMYGPTEADLHFTGARHVQQILIAARLHSAGRAVPTRLSAGNECHERTGRTPTATQHQNIGHARDARAGRCLDETSRFGRDGRRAT